MSDQHHGDSATVRDQVCQQLCRMRSITLFLPQALGLSVSGLVIKEELNRAEREHQDAYEITRTQLTISE